MALGNLAGRARQSTRNPSAFAICDRCGFCDNLDRLTQQFEWGGAALFNTGYLVCRRCLDKPQDQFRSLILPPDPIPRTNPRPDYWQTPPFPAVTPGNQGFLQFVLSNTTGYSGGAGIGQFAIGVSRIGMGAVPPSNQIYPTSKTGALFSIKTFTGIPIPVPLRDRGITLANANRAQALMAANPSRSWLAIYSPSEAPSAINLATAVWGLSTNLMIGPGELWFWATASGFGPTYTGAITAISLQPGNPLWAWESP